MARAITITSRETANARTRRNFSCHTLRVDSSSLGRSWPAVGGNRRLAFGEIEKVAKAEIRQLLLEQVQDSQPNVHLIDAELKSLIESSKRMGRKDWFNLAIGTLINLAIAIALPPEITRQAFEILRDALGGIVDFLPPIIAGGTQLLA